MHVNERAARPNRKKVTDTAAAAAGQATSCTVYARRPVARQQRVERRHGTCASVPRALWRAAPCMGRACMGRCTVDTGTPSLAYVSCSSRKHACLPARVHMHARTLAATTIHAHVRRRRPPCTDRPRTTHVRARAQRPVS